VDPDPGGQKTGGSGGSGFGSGTLFPQEKISPNKSPLLSSCRYSEVMTTGKKKIREHSPHQIIQILIPNPDTPTQLIGKENG
jgi:hypothetical protein